MFKLVKASHAMKDMIMAVYLVSSLLFMTNFALAVTVINHDGSGGSFDVTSVPGIAAGNTPSGVTGRFGMDAGEYLGQSFTLDQDITLDSIYIGYAGYKAGSTLTLYIDTGDDATSLVQCEYSLAGIVFDSGVIHDSSNDGPFSYVQFDLTLEGIVLSAGRHAYNLKMTAEDGSSWAFAPSRNVTDTYAGGSTETLGSPPITGEDHHFAVTGTDPVIYTAFSPNPSRDAKTVSITTDLSWNEPTEFTPSSYDVYFGTEADAYNNPKYTVTTNHFTPENNLQMNTVYYWVVDSYDGPTKYPGNLWHFRTISPKDQVAGNMMMINDNAGWCWYQDEKIIYDPAAGNVITSTAANYLGYGGEPRDGDIDTTVFNLDTGARTMVTMAKIPTLGKGDDHNVGALWIRPDGRYLSMYTGHNYGAGYNDTVDWGDDNEPRSFWRTSANPNEGSVWQTEQAFTWPETDIYSPINNDVTYSNLHYLSAEGSGMGRLYNIARSCDRTPTIMYSDDWGQTWKYGGRLSQTDAADQGGQYSNGYFKFASNGLDRIDFIATEHHPRDYNTSIYHGYIKGGQSYDSFDNVIDPNIFDDVAPAPAEFTLVFAALPVAGDTYHHAWTVELELDRDNRPVGLFTTRYGTAIADSQAGDADHRLFYAHFDGFLWTCTELAKMGRGLHRGQQDYTGLGAIHPNNSSVIYISTPYDPRDDAPLGYHENFRGVTTDHGATWRWAQITSNSTTENLRPAIPAWDATNTAVFWLRGRYPHQRDYDETLVGMIDRLGESTGLTRYLDATTDNTTLADGLPLAATGPDSGDGIAGDNQWHEYTGYGNGGSCYVANENSTENAPALKTKITGLQDGTYDIFAYFWADPGQDWRIRGGFSESDMLVFRRYACQQAPAERFTDSVGVLDGSVALYRAYIGRREVMDGTAIDVYIDDIAGASSSGSQRTVYDGLGVAPVLYGDLTDDGKVDLYDMVELSRGWQAIYFEDILMKIAEDWLKGLE